jgi:penicillin-binding protein 2
MHLSRNRIIQVIFIFAALVFVVKLFLIQVISTEYSAAAEKNIVQRIEEYPYRGIIYDRNKRLLVYNNPIYDLVVIPKAIRNLDPVAFCQTFHISQTEFNSLLTKAKRYSTIRPSVFIKNIDHYELARVQDQLVDYVGFYIRARTVRQYPQAILGNTLGYLGEINATQLASNAYQEYKQGDFIGISGLEAQYEQLLSGKRGVKHKITDARGQEKGAFKAGSLDIPSEPGQDLMSTIDTDLQVYGELLMKSKSGSIVAIEPATGEILAMVSSPSYDPNLLTAKHLKTNFTALEKDPASPLFHRPIMAMYPPGSIFKLVQALIGLQEKVIFPHTTYPCNKSIVNCHPHPSPTNLHQAIQYSCNPYFYYDFRNIINQHISSDTYEDTRIGLERWVGYVRQFGLGKPLGVDLPHEKGGYIPDARFYDSRYGAGRWKASTIRSLDIGQGEMLVTPLQMANLAAIMANRGFYYTPHLIRRNTSKQGEEERRVIAIDQKHFEFVANAMQDVIANGSGWRARIKGIAVCGKTGTAENPHGADHAVFMGFAPWDHPQIAIAVYVENSGWGSRSATAMGGLLLEKYLTGKVSRQWMENYVLQGNFED